ncbi:CopG family transcriptional regulator [Desulfobulbus sp. AH-315-M07]|nr:CopG family transcriptional regulator [Desulfobulbus sp. AH-315-M07]
MLSFRVEDSDAEAVKAWAERLGVERSQLLRDALRRHLAKLASERDVAAWQKTPMSEQERTVSEIADWGPAEDWSDWADASG